jgi:hypothetical protein
VSAPLPQKVFGWADISDDELYRYALGRVWDEALPVLVYIMLNPSTADALEPDHTITKCVGFARRWGFGGILVLNLWALRSTDPKGLKHALLYAIDPVGPENNEYLSYFARAARDTDSDVIVAWGLNAAGTVRRDIVVELLAREGVDLWAIAETKDGEPGHPLMLPYASKPIPWMPAHHGVLR